MTTRGEPPLADPVRSACPDTPVPVARTRPRCRQRLTALVEVVLCSGYPTQLLLIGVLAVLGLAAIDESGTLSLSYIFVLSMADTVLLLWLLFYFLRRHQEHPAEVFLGARPRRREFRLGLVLTPVVLGVALGSVSLLHYLWPALRNVPENPFEALLGSPLNAALFAVVAVVAGGVREELQRAFVLRRFEQHLGGGAMGLVVFSLAFGLGALPAGVGRGSRDRAARRDVGSRLSGATQRRVDDRQPRRIQSDRDRPGSRRRQHRNRLGSGVSPRLLVAGLPL